MNLYDFLERINLNTKSQHKKWLDVSSSHFSLIQDYPEDYTTIKRIVRYAKEVFLESGRHLVLHSSGHYYTSELGEKLPIFLRPVRLDIHPKEKNIFWTGLNESYILNPDLNRGQMELASLEIEPWLDRQEWISSTHLSKGSIILYFDLSHKAYIQRDLQKIKSRKLTSGAIEELWNHEIFHRQGSPNPPEFLSMLHGLPMDFSQASAIDLARKTSCVIAGPPGTGKSQTMINIAIQEILDGKKVAILSQKKVALDVIEQRLNHLNLDSLSLSLSTEQFLENLFTSTEQTLEYYLSHEKLGISETFNLTYFKHCVRTIADYFEAVEKHSDEKDNRVLDNLPSASEHSIFNLIYPNANLLKLSPAEILGKLRAIQHRLKKYNIPAVHTLRFIHSLDQPLHLLAKVNMAELRKLLKHKKNKEVCNSMEQRKKTLLLSKPCVSILEIIGEEKLNYYHDFLSHNKFWSKIYNPKAKEINVEISALDTGWNSRKIWDKMALIKAAMVSITWRNNMEGLLEEEKIFRSANYNEIASESLTYIENKIKSKLPAWLFVQEHWIFNPEFDLKTWTGLLSDMKELLNLNVDLDSMSISNFVEADLSESLDISRSAWEKLCCLEFKNHSTWMTFKSPSSKIQSSSPVLKNYSTREIVSMSSFVRTHYAEFIAYSLKYEVQLWQEKKREQFASFLKSRKPETKEKRDNWKSSIQFIQKRWSKKRTQPSRFQWLKSIDTEFLLWLKPLTISTLDKFSQYLPLESELFDTILIDEASQVELQDSIPALLRAKKIIVVGDSQQLTPSRFFKYQNYGLEAPHESLLELAEEKLNSYQLRGHYRSSYRELIHFSNLYFYQNSLSVTHLSSSEAIERIYLNKAIYHERQNRLEAQRIVTALEDIVKQHGITKTCGIVSFSIQQKEMILATLDEVSSTNHLLRNALNSWEVCREPFFVKSIEQVQGDERDIILISTGYGKNSKGKLFQFFGPILKFKGENRLNVLMSRAREKIIWVTSLLSSDLHITPSSSMGLIRFQQLLAYMENPITESPRSLRKTRNYWEYLIRPLRI